MAAILFGHPCLLSGGSELAVAWGVQALLGSHKVGIVTGCPCDLGQLNRHCGTSLEEIDMGILCAPQWLRRAIGHTDALRGALFARYLRSVASGFDVCISGYNMMDFGRPAIQFIADMSFDDALRHRYHPLPGGVRRLFHRPGMLRKGYATVTRTIVGRSDYRGVEDWLVANSTWTANLLRSRLGLLSNRVIFPPVADAVAALPWAQREAGFVILGRVTHEKRIVGMIDILARVRAAGHDVHLHLMGTIGDDEYGQMIRDRIARNSNWCSAVGYMAGAEKMAFLARHRFAIHGCLGEAFGVAVAEYVKAGCIAFVPHQGGPAEIVGTNELTYQDEDEAVAKIVRLLENPGRQREVQAYLTQRATLFSTERFMTEVRVLVADWLRHCGDADMGSRHAG
ncbi:glycosyltransferase [uncultured Thiodictyon sp.]|jgi:glycosyltransferase involved in cell wall biosynthesis|uniref:glycosyltransferase n=1 Tax=uncultured Thiodictyon sp. TaxID=1846217 RepID=UPI0025CC565E|nr:glycosyltransferase [uncultured Thiodictyon sp.]